MSEPKEYVAQIDDSGKIHISEEVLTVTAAAATLEVDGVSALAGGLSDNLADLVSGKKLGRGIEIRFHEEQIAIRVSILVKYGYVIPDVGKAVQDAVATAMENTTGVKVESVNVHVAGVVFPR